MATQVITRTLCDLCQADDIEMPDAERVPITLFGDLWEIDLCKTHGEPLRDLAATLAEHGRKVPSRTARAAVTPSDGERVPCPQCGALLRNRGSLGSHARNIHDVTLGELLGETADYACAHCERVFTTPQGKAVHESRVHRP